MSGKEDSPPEDCTWLGSIPVPAPPSSPLEGGFAFLHALGQWTDDLQKGQAGLALGSWWGTDGHGKSSRPCSRVEDGGKPRVQDTGETSITLPEYHRKLPVDHTG